MTAPNGMVAAGDTRSARVGADVLGLGGNAVDAAVAAVLASWVCEPLLTGPGAGGYMLVAGPGVEPTLLDFFVAAPGIGRDGAGHEPLMPFEVSFGDAVQLFNCGAASVGVPGMPAGLDAAASTWGTVPLPELAAPAAALAREGVPLNFEQAYVFEILVGMLVSTPQARAEFTNDGVPLRAGEPFRSPELSATIERFGAEGAAPFYRGDIAAAIVADVEAGGGLLGAGDLEAYEAIERRPARSSYRGLDVLTNPPPSAGGILLTLAFEMLEADGEEAPTTRRLVEVMEEVQALRTPAFTAELAEPGFLERFLAANLGSTTHVSAIDSDGLACSVTCTNGEGSGLVVPGTGIHLNNIMGEEDLSPSGFFTAPPGLRMPSMMAPTVVTEPGGQVRLAVGSAGSNRIRSAILQVVVNALARGMEAGPAVYAPRIHVEGGVLYAEPGIDLDGLGRSDLEIVRFRAENLFFGGAQLVEREPLAGGCTGAGDPRRGGAAVAA
ncbi:MAG: gamma-glutamyltransferase [Solirubrobacteraceae bacterium]|nr:gamma-glutamyltransferase [Solirubrobacteraceae bacterium]